MNKRQIRFFPMQDKKCYLSCKIVWELDINISMEKIYLCLPEIDWPI